MYKMYSSVTYKSQNQMLSFCKYLSEVNDLQLSKYPNSQIYRKLERCVISMNKIINFIEKLENYKSPLNNNKILFCHKTKVRKNKITLKMINIFFALVVSI